MSWLSVMIGQNIIRAAMTRSSTGSMRAKCNPGSTSCAQVSRARLSQWPGHWDFIQGAYADKYDWAGKPSTDSAAVMQQYDEMAPTYDATLLNGWGYQAPAVAAELLARYVDLQSTVLDVGCGTGLTDTSSDGLDLQPCAARISRQPPCRRRRTRTSTSPWCGPT